VNRDPIGYEGSKWNLYEYVGGKCTCCVDPDGKLTWNYKKCHDDLIACVSNSIDDKNKCLKEGWWSKAACEAFSRADQVKCRAKWLACLGTSDEALLCYAGVGAGALIIFTDGAATPVLVLF